MKKFFFVSLLAQLFIVDLAAADWTGIYAGLSAGGAINHSRYKLKPTGCFLAPTLCGGPPSTNPLRTDKDTLGDVAFTGGGQIGGNYQIGSFVTGLETDFNYNGTDDKDVVNRPLAAPLIGNFVHTVKQKFDYFGTLRGRIGFTPVDQLLVFLSGGMAYGSIRSSTNALFTSSTDTYAGSASTTRVGWTAGVGAEYAFAQPWSVKFEYLYLDLGKITYNDPCVAPALLCASFNPSPSYQTGLKVHEHIVRLGVNFKFFTF